MSGVAVVVEVAVAYALLRDEGRGHAGHAEDGEEEKPEHLDWQCSKFGLQRFVVLVDQSETW